jgi:uncharacterized membrane protein YkvA (DUF1232 family)
MSGKDMVVVDPRKFARDQERVHSGFWRKVKRYAGKVPFLDEALAGYYSAIDPKTPLQAKAIIMGALAYFVVPVDMMPDFIAWLGFSDDAAVFYAALRTVNAHIKDHHRTRARLWLEKNQDIVRETAESDRAPAKPALRPRAADPSR